jgi:hypothetical protein
MSKLVDELQKTLEFVEKSNEEAKQMLKNIIAKAQDSSNHDEELLDVPQKEPVIPDTKEPKEGQELLVD